jgi:exopolysaccharide biosynthesis protein
MIGVGVFSWEKGEDGRLNTTAQVLQRMKRELWGWSWLKLGLLLFSILIFFTSSFLYLTSPGLKIREFLAGTVITTQHRDWAWIFVGTEKRDLMVRQVHSNIEQSASEKINLGMIKHRQNRSVDELIKVEDISDKFWKGKLMYVYDPTSVKVIAPEKQGEGERISSMVERTGAVAGINGGGFVDPDGLGNGFLPIGLIMSDFKPLWTDADADTQQFMIGFTENGTLIVGKYSLNELRDLKVKEAVSFYAPRLIANGIPQITTGDGGWGRAPRTAVGQMEDGTLIMVVIDGRQAHSVGATLKEVQDLLLARGVVNAGLLDGGASSELVLKDGGLVTKPSSRWGERRLPSGLLVYDNPDEVIIKSPWEGLTNIDPGGRHDHPEYLRDLQSGKLKEEPPANTRVQDPIVPNSQTEKPASGNTGSGTNGAGGGTQKPGTSTTAPPGGKPAGSTAPSSGTNPGATGGGAPAAGGTAAPPSNGTTTNTGAAGSTGNTGNAGAPGSAPVVNPSPTPAPANPGPAAQPSGTAAPSPTGQGGAAAGSTAGSPTSTGSGNTTTSVTGAANPTSTPPAPAPTPAPQTQVPVPSNTSALPAGNTPSPAPGQAAGN